MGCLRSVAVERLGVSQAFLPTNAAYHSKRPDRTGEFLMGYFNLEKLPHVIITAVLSIAIFLAGCGGRNGSSGTLPYDGWDDSVTIVTTKLSLALGAAKTGMPKAVSFADVATESVYMSATVTLTLADGRTFRMAYAGNGEFYCTVSNLSPGSAGYIQADINEMTLKNLFNNAVINQNILDAGDLNPDSTLVTDMLEAFAGAVPMADLLAGLQNATIEIDVQSLKAEVANGAVTSYELARRAYNAVLTLDNIGLPGAQIISMLENDPDVSPLMDSITVGGLPAPVTGTDSDQVKALAGNFLNAYFNTRTTSAVSPYLDDTNFLLGGENKLDFLSSLSAKWAADPMFTGLDRAEFTNLNYAVMPATDFTGLGLTMYNCRITGTYDLVYLDGTVLSRAYDGPESGLLVAKVSNLWVFFGDKQKMTYEYSIGNYTSSALGRFTEIVLEVKGSGAFSPVSVTLDCQALFGATPVVLLSQNSRDYFVKLTGGSGMTWLFENGQNSQMTATSFLGLDGKALKVTVTYADNSTETYTKVVSIDTPSTLITSFTENQDGSISVSWKPPVIDETLLYVEVKLALRNLAYYFPATTRSYTIPAADLQAAGLDPTESDSLQVIYHSALAQYTYSQPFTYAAGSLVP